MSKTKKQKCHIRPLGDRLLVNRVEEEAVRQSGIIIPDTAKEKPLQAKVVAVGQGKRGEDGKLIAMDVAVGQMILFGKYAGTEVDWDGVEYLILKEGEVLGVLV
ncbi:MAG: chaperonin GroES [Candidatus Latescibacterota bacterium]|jgi:chaperonin GroES